MVWGRRNHIVEHLPAFIDDERSARTAERILDRMKEKGQNGGRGLGAGQPVSLEGLHCRGSEVCGLVVEQPLPRPQTQYGGSTCLRSAGQEPDTETGVGTARDPLGDAGLMQCP